MNSFVRERLYYEIAMSIGNSLDIEVMLKEGLSTYLRKLNCLAGAVLRREESEEGLSSFQPVYAIPKRMKRNSAVREAIQLIPDGLDGEALETYLANLPSLRTVSGQKHYVMELPGFGLLLLVKSAPGLSQPDLRSLAPLNAKLAGSCLSCMANEQLQREIADRERAEDKYRSIFENSVEGMFQTTLDGRYMDVNPALARLLGFDSPREVVTHYNDLANQLYADPQDRQRFLRRLNNKGRVTNFELQYHRSDGSLGWCSLSARLILGEDGQPTHIEGMVSDITPRKQAIDALREAKDEAERLSQMKSNFLSMVSHELRTPLTSILGFAKIIRKRMLETLGEDNSLAPDIMERLSRMEGNAGVIVAEGERLTELINNVLDLARLEAGRFVWRMEDVSMNLVLAHSLASTSVLFDDNGVTLEERIDEGLPLVLGDHDRLIQVVINLLSNAAKFTDKGSVTVSAAPEDGHVVVRVADTGHGVPEEESEAIFDKFRQLGDTLTDKPMGTGLGLPICKEIVEHHGGRIWVEPNPGGGSIFAFSVPVVSAG